jgi:hypothetical protein
MKKLAIISTFILGLAATSCDSYLDINESPNSPKEGDLNASIVMPGAEMNLVGTYGDYMRITGGYYAQYYTQSFGTSNYLDYSQFQQSATRSSSSYAQLNNRALKSMQLVRDIATNNENWGDYLAATVLRAFTYQVLVDCYGEVPYTEALDPSNPTPHYDDGQTIYDGIIAELDDALSKVKASDPVCTNFLFPGQNAGPWIEFANALKLRILSRESGVKNVDAQIGAIISSGNLPTSDIAYEGCWTSEAGHISPFYAEEFATNWGSTQINCVANIAIIGSMQVKDSEGAVVYEDPRLPAFFEKNGSGNYTGGISGSNFSTSSSYKSAYWCRPVAKFDMPVYMITVAETEFFIAEYYARTGNAAEAEAHYNAAVEASFATAGVDGAEGFVAQWPYDQSNYKKSIGIAKWIALAGVNTFEGYCELRRLDYPAFGSVKGSDMYNETDDSSYAPGKYVAGTLYTPIKCYGPVGEGHLLERWPYAESSSARNSNAPEFPGYTTPVFWGK